MPAEAIIVDGLTIPANATTLAGFRAWVRELGEGAPRAHFYRGEVHIEVSPQDRKSHWAVVSDINAQLGNLARKLDIGRYGEQGAWITNPEAKLSTEPDGQLLLWETFEAGEARLIPLPDGERSVELEGRVDMVLEVVSKTSERKDTAQLLEGYARAGITEYWLVDARGESFEWTIYSLTEGGSYEPLTPDEDGWVFSPVWDGCFKLERTFDRIGMPRIDLAYRSA